MLNKKCLNVVLISLLALMGCQSTGGRLASSGAVIDREVDAALKELYATTPAARGLASRAKGILVFPDIVKAGFMFGGQYGRGGALRKKGRTVGYYNSVAASYGLQVGVQSFGYALFFMNDAALSYLDRSEGWEIGVGPGIVVVDAGVAKSLTTTTGKDNIYAFIFNQKGLMAGLGLQGSKISRINPD
ncbi:MAG: twin-arginine translocation pathway signal protein [Methylococcales bacterium]|nr:twin-arginine translocation pathway signal protein [Methylococcales bacterium]